MIDVEEVKDEMGNRIGLLIAGDADTMTQLMIKQLQAVVTDVLHVLLWGSDKEVARDILKDACRMLHKATLLIPGAQVPMMTEDLPAFYALAEEDFEKVWAEKERMQPAIKDMAQKLKEEGALNVGSTINKKHDAVH